MSKIISFPAIVSSSKKSYRIQLIDFQEICVTGKTIEQASSKAQEKMISALEKASNIPTPTSDYSNISLNPGQFIILISTDISAFKDTTLVKKNLSIPAWLNKKAVEKGINFSKLLQKALKEELGISD